MNNKEFRPTIPQLRAFVSIAENRHFSVAASRLGISQPSLSQALSALETGLGIQLIERSTRRVIVTAAGQALLPYARAALSSADDFLAHARGVSDVPTGPLTIGMIPTVAPYILPKLMSGVSEHMPDIRLNIVEEQTNRLVDQLRQGTIDLAVIALPMDDRAFVVDPLYTEDFYLVTTAGHPLGGLKNLSTDILMDLDLLLLDDGHCLRDQVLDLCRGSAGGQTTAHHRVTRAASITTVVQCVAGGLGCTLVPASALEVECLHNPKVAVSSFDPAGTVQAHREVGLVYRASSTDVRGDQFHAVGQLVSAAYAEAVKGI